MLARHRLLGFTAPETLNLWPLRHRGGNGLAIQPTLTASSGETLLHLALHGAGIACLNDLLTAEDLRSGRLLPVLDAISLPWSQTIWAVFQARRAGAACQRLGGLPGAGAGPTLELAVVCARKCTIIMIFRN